MVGTKVFSRIGAVAAAVAIAVGMMVGGCGDENYTYTGRTVKIGNLTWMAENLNRATSNSWCYDNDEANCAKYGRLYTWDAAMKACPAGWRLPSREDWNDLVQSAGGNPLAGERLKSKTDWRLPNDKEINYIAHALEEKDVAKFVDEFKASMTLKAGTDEYGFSALPGGVSYTDGSFLNAGFSGYWWSATEHGSGNAYGRYMDYGNELVFEDDGVKDNGFSVRCVK